MERLRLATFELEAPPSVPAERFVRLGAKPETLEELRALDPEVVLVGYRGAADALWKAERCAQALPGAALLLAGPALSAPDVIAVVRAGARDVLGDADAAAWEQALERAWSHQQRLVAPRPDAPGRRRVTVVHSPKGGSGKSFLAANLACLLQGVRPVALVDLAVHSGDLDLMLDLRPQATWADLVTRREFGPEEIEAALCTHPSGLKLLAAPRQLEQGELVTARAVERVLGHLGDRYEVVVDTDSALSEATLRALELADRIVLPVPMTLSALRQVQRALGLWPHLGISLDKVELVAWDQKGEVTPQEAERILGRSMNRRLPYQPQEVEAAINAGEPLALSKPRSAYVRQLSGFLNPQGEDRRPETQPIVGWLTAWRRRDVSPQQA